jgi:hypothetical protein
MNPSTRLPFLRYAIARRFAHQQRNTFTVTPGLHHLLAVPIHERLILLARIDGATPHQVRRILHCSIEDANCRSDVMLDAVATWRSTMQDAYWPFPTPSNWRFQREASVEKGLKQLIWTDVAVALIGDAALPELVQPFLGLTLQRRLILYCLMGEDMRREAVRRQFRCSDWNIREAMRIAIHVTGYSSGSVSEAASLRQTNVSDSS